MQIGAAVHEQSFSADQAYRETLINNFNCLYPVQAFKMACYFKAPDIYDFSKRDIFLANLPPDLPIRINALFWRESMPNWIFRLNSIEERWEYIQKALLRLLAPLQSLGQEIYVDAVNEPLKLHKNTPTYSQRMSDALGDNWIEEAFSLCAHILPRAKLFLCQHLIKSEAIWAETYSLIQKTKDNCPLHGTALQVQSTLPAAATQGLSDLVAKRVEQFRELGEVQIPEIAIWPWEAGNNHLPRLKVKRMQSALCKKQANIYCSILEISKSAGASLAGFWSPIDGAPWEWIYGDRQNPELGLFSKTFELKSEQYRRIINGDLG